MLEHEAVLVRQARSLGLARRDVSDFLDYVCSVARVQPVFCVWLPRLKGHGDDMVLEAAVAAGARYIVTFNKRDFESDHPLPVRLATPQEFLHILGVPK